MMQVRKSFVNLADDERSAFLAALIELKARRVSPEADFTIYDRFIAIHAAALRVRSPHDPGREYSAAHGGPALLPWHREYLVRVQKELSKIDPSVVIPYWDWTAHDATVKRLFSDDFLGAAPPASELRPVSSGYFTPHAPSANARPDWWPKNATGWILPESIRSPGSNWGGVLHRSVGGFGRLPTEQEIARVGQLHTYREFSRALEAGLSVGADRIPTHNAMHRWVGGHMANAYVAPFDPAFLLHHAYVDYLWDRWQRNGHAGADYYPSTDDWGGQGAAGDIGHGHLLHDPMFPWVGDTPGYASDVSFAAPFLPDTSGESPRHPIDVLDTANLAHDKDFNYEYAPPAEDETN